MKLYAIWWSFCFLAPFVAAFGSCPSFENARTSLQNKDFETAESAFLCLVTGHPEDRDAWRSLSDLYWWKGEVEKSLEASQKVRELSQRTPIDEDLLFHATKRLSRYQVSASYQSVISNHDTLGHEISANGGLRYYQKNQILLGFDRHSRSFAGGTTLTDNIFRLGHNWIPDRLYYLETSAAYSPSHHFSAEWRLILAPHLILPDDSDLSLGFDLGLYDHATTVVFKPAWRKDLNDEWALGLSSSIEGNPEQAVSGSGWLSTHWNSRLQSKITVSGGKADDGDGLIDTFVQYSVDVGYKILPPLELQIQGSEYLGQNRDETRIGASVLWSF